MTLERIKEALETIQEMCVEQGSCERCPLGTSIDGKCLIRETEPTEWVLRSLTDIKLIDDVR